MALGDSGTFKNPGIAGLYHSLQIEIRQHSVRGIAAESANLYFEHAASQSGWISENRASDLDMLNAGQMQDQPDGRGSGSTLEGLQSALFFESPDEIYARVFRQLKPRTPLPAIHVEFRPFANADSTIRQQNGDLYVHISDLLQG